MYQNQHITVVIPAHNESLSITRVIDELQQLCDADQPLVDEIIVANNASTDNTGELARQCGATVVDETRPGYGSACLAAIKAIEATDIVVFVDGDYSVEASELPALLSKLDTNTALVVGERKSLTQESGALLPQQSMGTQLAVYCINLLWPGQVTDLGPFRAIRYQALKRIDMQDTRFGWTTEMQIKALQQKLPMREHPVHVRKRIGHSKISGTVKGTLRAAQDIFGTIFKLWLKQHLKINKQTTSTAAPKARASSD